LFVFDMRAVGLNRNARTVQFVR